jgi:hypothetical protein
MNSWYKALSTFFTVAEAKAIEESASSFQRLTGDGRHIVSALRADHFLPPLAMKKFQAFFLGADWTRDRDMVDEYGQLCIQHVTLGGKIKAKPLPRRIGRALERESFIQQVFAGNGHIRKKDVVKLVDRLVTGTTTHTDNAVLSGLKMTPYAAWVTWDETTAGDEDPFGFSKPSCADDIRANLGLSTEGYTQPIILIEYSGSDVLALLRPTCADAGLFLRFEPPPPKFKPYGLTKPWEEFPPPCSNSKRDKQLTFKPRAEGLHHPIRFPSNLKSRRCDARR